MHRGRSLLQGMPGAMQVKRTEHHDEIMTRADKDQVKAGATDTAKHRCRMEVHMQSIERHPKDTQGQAQSLAIYLVDMIAATENVGKPF
jgi:hypothetical protein